MGYGLSVALELATWNRLGLDSVLPSFGKGSREKEDPPH